VSRAASAALALAVGCAALALSGCATAQAYVPAEEATRLQRELAGRHTFLAASMYVTPFFGDATHALLTPWPPDEVRLLENPDGSPIEPGPVELVLPVGTPVLVERVEFPSPATMAERVLYTPRSLIWVYLQARGSPRDRQLVLVLRPGLRSGDEVRAEIERSLASRDPSFKLEAWPEAVREAVRSKKAVLDMSREALEMAWGLPERIRIELKGTERVETWRWPGSRAAVLTDGRVTSLP
jgi:hypothetical protein